MVPVCVVALIVTGQVALQDDFEGTLLESDVPPGVWSYLANGEKPSNLSVNTAAAHAGRSGLRVTDSDVSDGSGVLKSLGKSFTGTGNQFVRTWFRIAAASTSIDSYYSILMIHGSSTIKTAAEVVYLPLRNELSLNCFDRMSNEAGVRTRVVLTGGWNLIELEVKNLGSSNGVCALTLNGTEIQRTQNIDWGGLTFTQLIMGMAFADFQPQAVFDFDSYRASPAAMASRISLNPLTPSVAVGQCAKMRVQLVDSKGQPAPVPQTVSLSLSSPGADIGMNCGEALSSVTLSAASPQVEVFVRPKSAGQKAISATNIDYLPTSTTIDATEEDAGFTPMDAGPGDSGLMVDAGGSDSGLTADAGLPVLDSGSDGYGDAGASDASMGMPNVLEDGGTRPVPGDEKSSHMVQYQVGCGCQTNGWGLSLAALVLMVTRLGRLRKTN